MTDTDHEPWDSVLPDPGIASYLAEASPEPFDAAQLADDLLTLFYPPTDPHTVDRAEMPHDRLQALVADGGANGAWFAALLADRRGRAATALRAVFPHMAAAAIQAYENDIQAAVDELPPHQPVPVDTLRRWAVWSDQIADYSSQRVRRASTGARHLADDIRREIAHPSDQPHAAPDQYLNPHLFDSDRQDPSDDEQSTAAESDSTS